MYRVSFTGLDELQAKLRAAPHIVQDEMGRAMNQSTITVESAVRPITPVGVSSLLRNTVNSEVREAGGGKIVGVVGSGISEKEHYPWVVELGRKPGKGVPLIQGQGLMLWVQRKIRPDKNELYGVARAVARAIARRGTKGQGMFIKGWDKSKDKVVGYFRDALKRVVERL